MDYITSYIEGKAVSYLSGGVTTVGGMAGNAVGGVGSLIETTGRAVGNSENLRLAENIVRETNCFQLSRDSLEREETSSTATASV